MSLHAPSLAPTCLVALALTTGCSGGSDGSTPPAAYGGAGAAAGASAGSSGAPSGGGSTAGGAVGQAGSGGSDHGGGFSAGAGGEAGGAGGSAGSGGTGGGSAGSAGAPQDLPTSKDFVCSWVLGITTTGEWYKAGFEKVVDDARWQVTPIEMGHLEKWADPSHEIWQSAIQSPCAQNSKTPDRVVFNATKYEWTTVDEFVPAYVAVIGNIKTKYPSVKRIDLITYARAPGNMECIGANRSSYSYIKPVQDEAAAMMPAMFPGFVFVAPQWEHAACSDFGLCPHVSAEANATLAKTIGRYFLEN